jgi:hypothetical protein
MDWRKANICHEFHAKCVNSAPVNPVVMYVIAKSNSFIKKGKTDPNHRDAFLFRHLLLLLLRLLLRPCLSAASSLDHVIFENS